MVSPKWQAMWVESQHCSKSLVNVPLPSSLQAKKVLEDLKTSCCSPNKTVQLEALKCWGMWIHNQTPEDWKLNTVCFTAVRPLITKKLQPLHKDVDVCKLKLSLMWALLVKVQHMMELEGPQYILEAFLQSSLTWLSSSNGDGSENEVSHLIFQLLLGVFDKSETLPGCDIEMFPPLSSNLLHQKLFHLLADKFLNIFIYWRKIQEKSVILKIWKHFLGNCESSCKNIPIPVWHKIFKLVGQMCAEKDEPVKERLAFLHACATTLKSALSSSKFIDFGNLLTTPCEVLLKKLVELCSVECDEFRDSKMFWQSKETCQALSDKSVPIGGFDLCIGVLDVLEEFCLRSLFWGVWCGLVHCYNTWLKNRRSQLTKTEMKFYRKLRGVAVNFELDRNSLEEDCLQEVLKHIGFLSIDCLRLPFSVGTVSGRDEEKAEVEPMEAEPETNNIISKEIVPKYGGGRFSVVPLRGGKSVAWKAPLGLNFDLVKNVLNTLSLNSRKSLVSCMAGIRFVSIRSAERSESGNSLEVKVEVGKEEEVSVTVTCREAKGSPLELAWAPAGRNGEVCEAVDVSESEEEVISTPTTRSRKRAEEERKKELNMQRRRKRKSFEVLVQEIVRKNQERKTEKNSRKRKTSDTFKGRRKKKRMERQASKENQVVVVKERGKNRKPLESSDRKLRKKEEPAKEQKKKEKKSTKTDGKLENYFKVVTKTSVSASKKEVKKPSKAEKKKKTKEIKSCGKVKEKKTQKGEVGWKQTSLKAMMNPKNKAVKVKQVTRTRDKTEEKPKTKNGDRKPLNSPLSKSPFKEVFHDHEYAKMEPGKMKTIEKILNAEKGKKNKTNKPKPGRLDLDKMSKTKPLILRKAERKVSAGEKAPKAEKTERVEVENVAAEAPTPAKPKTSPPEKTKPPKPAETPKECKMEECEEVPEPEIVVVYPTAKVSAPVEDKPVKPFSELNEKNVEVQPMRNQVSDETRDELLEIGLKPEKKAKKRVRAMECVGATKRMKLEEAVEEDLLEEKLPLEVTEKENLEKSQPDLISPTKTEKSSLVGKSNGSPMGGGGGMSRALRIIGLVPESTMGRSWETSPKVEVLKCKKAPNVDKNSRASKMLALLFENVVEAEDVIKVDEEEAPSIAETTPNSKTPLSSLKSPKSNKKRKSIRFDDARNETVLYQTDTPPSQILEEKEKRRGMRPFQIALHLP